MANFNGPAKIGPDLTSVLLSSASPSKVVEFYQKMLAKIESEEKFQKADSGLYEEYVKSLKDEIVKLAGDNISFATSSKSFGGVVSAAAKKTHIPPAPGSVIESAARDISGSGNTAPSA